MTITAKQLAQIMFEELEREAWGDIDPCWFKPEENSGESDEDAQALMGVLERVVQRLNAEPVSEAPKWWECSWCDGCGWYEGGADVIQTKCEKCAGRGVHNREGHRGRPIFAEEAQTLGLAQISDPAGQ